MSIDVTFAMTSDSLGVDPDDLRSGSPTLRDYHRALWSRPAVGTQGEALNWQADARNLYLWHETEILGRFAVSSDTIVTSHRAYSRFAVSSLYKEVEPERREQFHRVCSTIGGFIVFPVHLQSINQRRGSAPLCDRFDLALECIRRHYEEPDSHNPLGQVLARNSGFFDLFGDFSGYVQFFYLDPLVNSNGTVNWHLDNVAGDLSKALLPQTMSDYLTYLDRQEAFVLARNQLIAADFPGEVTDESPESG